jgi:hypothetical protein
VKSKFPTVEAAAKLLIKETHTIAEDVAVTCVRIDITANIKIWPVSLRYPTIK